MFAPVPAAVASSVARPPGRSGMRRERDEPSPRLGLVPAGDRGEQAGVDVAAGEDRDRRAVDAARPGRRGSRPRRPRPRPRRRACSAPAAAPSPRRSSSSSTSDHVVEVGAQDRERDSAGALDRDAVGDRERGRRFDRLAALHRLRVRRAGRGLDADDPRRPAVASLIDERDARAQPAAADRHDDLREVGHVLEQLEPERALAGDDRGVVERVHEGEPAVLGAFERGRRHASTLLPPTWTIAPLLAGRLDLGHRRVGGDEDLAGDASCLGGRGERLGVVAGACRHDAVRAALVAERRELGGHAADLERAGALEVLGLEHDRPARTLGERAGGEDRCAARDGLHRRACGPDVARGEGHSAMIASISTSAPIGRAATPMVVRAGGSLLEVAARRPRSSRRTRRRRSRRRRRGRRSRASRPPPRRRS